MRKRNFVPVNEQQRDLILKIQKDVCNSEFMNDFRMNLIPETFDIYTVVLAFMDGLHSLFSRPDIDMFNIGDILIIEKSVRDKVKAEKSGNINCVMKLGPIAFDLINEGISGYRDALIDNEDMQTAMLAISSLAVKSLEDYAIGGLKQEDVYHITIAFFTYMILTVNECANNGNIDPNEFGLEIGSHLAYFEIRYMIKRNKPIIVLNVGPALKLTVKSDGQTE